MAVSDRENIRRLALALLTGVAVCALVSPAAVARAQDAQPAASLTTDIPEDAKLLLAANELLYDRDAERVTAVGGVQINYGGYQMVARKVVYDQKSGRMTAAGNIEMIEPGGNRIEFANAEARLLLDPDWPTVEWSEAERAKGQAWGMKTVATFHTHGTPYVENQEEIDRLALKGRH